MSQVFLTNSQISSIPHPKNIGYLRVSTNEQDLQKNKADTLTLDSDKDLEKVHWAEATVPRTAP